MSLYSLGIWRLTIEDTDQIPSDTDRLRDINPEIEISLPPCECVNRGWPIVLPSAGIHGYMNTRIPGCMDTRNMRIHEYMETWIHEYQDTKIPKYMYTWIHGT